jgi:hypothetical protein
MVFCHTHTLHTLNILTGNPELYYNTFLNDSDAYSKDVLDTILKDYDNESYYFNGGNALHCLCMIIGKSNTNDEKVDVECSCELAIDIFELLIKSGCNPYHYDHFGQNPLQFIKQLDKENIEEFIKYMLNYYIHNPPVLDTITVTDYYYSDTHILIQKLIDSNEEYLKTELFGKIYNKYNNLSYDNYSLLLDGLTKHYIMYPQKYNKIEELTYLIKNKLK